MTALLVLAVVGAAIAFAVGVLYFLGDWGSVERLDGDDDQEERKDDGYWAAVARHVWRDTDWWP